MGIVAIIKLNKSMIGICILCIIIGKFSYQKESSLNILLVIDKSFKINFYYTIVFFALAISLKVKDSGELLLNFEKVIK